VPPKPIRTLRNLTRYRKSNIRDRQRGANRLHKIMEDTGIKLDCVATDLLGKSGRAMLDALVSGTTDPNVLADLARGVLRKKIPALREALHGRFDAEHALVVGQILAHSNHRMGPASSGTGNPVLADLNGDGNLDIAVPLSFPGWEAGNVAVALGRGDGRFTRAEQYRAGRNSSSVAAGDMNGDALPDLAVANYSSADASLPA
jgi:hypothetical protein